MTALARLVLRHKRAIVFLWLALTLIGAYSANAVSKRWLEQFSIPGYSAYEANQRTLKTFGTGENAPLVAVFQSAGDVTKVTGIKPAIAAAARQNPGSRVCSYFSTGSAAQESEGGGDIGGPTVFLEALRGGVVEIVILLFVGGPVPAVLIPIGSA